MFCSHNPKVIDGKTRLSAKLQYLEDIYGQVVNLWEAGIRDEKTIFRKFKLKEVTLIKWFCCGNVSMLNLVRSVIRNF